MKEIYAIIIVFLTIISGCRNSSDQNTEPNAFITGEFKLDDIIFGETIELTGTPILSDIIFTPRHSHVIANDSILVLRLSSTSNPYAFYIFRLPDFTPIGKVGRLGRGPLEFNSPLAVRTADPTAIIYVREFMTGKMYRLTKKYSLEEIRSSFTPLMIGATGDNGIINISEDEYLYVNASRTKSKIVRTKYDKAIDQYNETELLDLRFNPEIDIYMAYWGELSANLSKDRMVFAYSYSPRIIFSNMKGDSTRVLIFPGTEYDIRTREVPDGIDLNTLYYYNAIAGDKYLYLIYSGRDPKDTRNGIIYNMYIEQWDWNGNPLRRYKLDQYGYIDIDEKMGKIYLVGDVSEIPFYVYDLPK